MTTRDDQTPDAETDSHGDSPEVNAAKADPLGLAEATPHQAIAALEEAGESATVIDGYLGTSNDPEVIRLYSAIDISTYVEIPRMAIIYIGIEKGDEPGRVRAYVRASSEILSVRGERLRAGDYRQKTMPEIDQRSPQQTEFERCAVGCLTAFKTAATQILIDELNVLRIPDRFQQQAAMLRIEEREEGAKSALYECLSSCFAAHRPPLGVTLGPYYTAVVGEFLERPG